MSLLVLGHISIAIFFYHFFKKSCFFYYFQNTPNTKAPLQHQIVLESCPDTDGMVWTGPLVLKRNCFNHKTKEKPLSKKPICGVLKICKIYQAIRPGSDYYLKSIHSEIRNVVVFSCGEKMKCTPIGVFEYIMNKLT